MKPLFPLLSCVAALGMAACDSQSTTAGGSSTPASRNGGTAADASGSDPASREVLPGKSKIREEVAKPTTTTTASGLKYTVMKSGTGTVHPTAADNVTVHYHGTLLDGTVFDSSVDRGQPATFPLNGVIPGWTEGVQLMKAGDKFKFEIPSGLAYGSISPSPAIPPDSTLVFEVELLEIK